MPSECRLDSGSELSSSVFPPLREREGEREGGREEGRQEGDRREVSLPSHLHKHDLLFVQPAALRWTAWTLGLNFKRRNLCFYFEGFLGEINQISAFSCLQDTAGGHAWEIFASTLSHKGLDFREMLTLLRLCSTLSPSQDDFAHIFNLWASSSEGNRTPHPLHREPLGLHPSYKWFIWK